MRVLTALVLVALLGAAVPTAAREGLDELEQKLAREEDPADRAKITVKIGKELLKQVSRAYRRNQPEKGRELLDRYMKAIEKAYTDLKESGIDARRHSKGFKDLEVHLRKSERTVQDIAETRPLEERAPLLQVVDRMETIRLELLTALMKTKLDLKDSAQEHP